MKNIYTNFVHGKREFEHWQQETNSILDYFFDSIYQLHGLKLDFSPLSLDPLEQIILQRYADISDVRDRYKITWLDDATRYIGSVYCYNLGGYWDIDYKSKSYVFYKMPLIELRGNGHQFCPRHNVIESIRRRTGNSLSNIYSKREMYLKQASGAPTKIMCISSPFTSENMKFITNTLIHTKREYEYWMFDIGFMVEYFLEMIDAEIREKLDFSLESLDVLEALLLERYPDAECANDRYEMLWLEDAARYVGDVIWKVTGGHWYVELAKKKSPDFQLPVIKIEDKLINPKKVIIGALEHRTGKYLSSSLLIDTP